MNSDGCSVTHFTQSVVHNTIHHHHYAGGSKITDVIETKDVGVVTSTLTERMIRTKVMIRPRHLLSVDPKVIRSEGKHGKVIPGAKVSGVSTRPFCCGDVYLTLPGDKKFEIGRAWIEEPPFSPSESKMQMLWHHSGLVELEIYAIYADMPRLEDNVRLRYIGAIITRILPTWIDVAFTCTDLSLRRSVSKNWKNPPRSLIPVLARRPPKLNLSALLNIDFNSSAPFPLSTNQISLARVVAGLPTHADQQQSDQKKKYIPKSKSSASQSFNQVAVRSTTTVTRPRFAVTNRPSTSSTHSFTLSRSRPSTFSASQQQQITELKEVIKHHTMHLEALKALLKTQGETLRVQSEALKMQSETLKKQSETLERLTATDREL